MKLLDRTTKTTLQINHVSRREQLTINGSWCRYCGPLHSHRWSKEKTAKNPQFHHVHSHASDLCKKLIRPILRLEVVDARALSDCPHVRQHFALALLYREKNPLLLAELIRSWGLVEYTIYCNSWTFPSVDQIVVKKKTVDFLCESALLTFDLWS